MKEIKCLTKMKKFFMQSVDLFKVHTIIYGLIILLLLIQCVCMLLAEGDTGQLFAYSAIFSVYIYILNIQLQQIDKEVHTALHTFVKEENDFLKEVHEILTRSITAEEIKAINKIYEKYENNSHQ